MELVRVKEKYQVTIPNDVRRRVRLAVGDYLAVDSGEGGTITLTPKSLIDRSVAEGLADLAAGRTHGPYKSADEAIAALESKARTSKPRKK